MSEPSQISNDDLFYKQIFRKVHGRWASPEEFSGWWGRFQEYWLVEDIAINDILASRLLLDKVGLSDYAKEVYWTSIAMLLLKHEEKTKNE